MLAAIAAFALMQSPPPYRPQLSIGSSAVLSSAVQKIGELTSKGDFPAALKATRLLPELDVKIEWDDSEVPAGSRFDFQTQYSRVTAEWMRPVPSIRFTAVKKDSDVRVKFTQGSAIAFEWSDDPLKPRLTAKIGLKWDSKDVDPSAVHNAFSYTIGTYFGIAKLPISTLIMSGSENPTQLPVNVSSLETLIASANLNVSQQIREQVKKSVVVIAGVPSLSGETAPVDMGKVLQGTRVPVRFDLKNTGTGNLVFRLIPDCNCFANDRLKVVEPNKSDKAATEMDTTEFAGTIHKTLYLFTNDPANPVRSIPVEVFITPRYRMLPPRQVVVADDDGITFTAYLFTPEGHPLKVKDAQCLGLPGQVTYEPWEGSLADPDMNEGPMPRKGYKFTLRIKDVPDGMQLTTNIAVVTDDPAFDQILYPVFVQKGILALPPRVFLGEIAAAPRTMSFLVSRPGKAFKISSVEADSSHLTVSYEPTKNVGEFKVTVVYDGKAATGDYRAMITIKTDDPKQPLVQVPVNATVK